MKTLVLNITMAIVLLMSLSANAQEGADIREVAEQGAQEVDSQDAVTADYAAAEVSLITCYPGPLSYELYGHTMVRVKIGWQDLLFNYGIFNFKEDGFVYRFVKGDCDYLLAAYPFHYLERGYEGRKIVEQVLNLDAEQKRKVIEYLWWNAMPENATYRYDWAYDNCATRPRDIIENAVGKVEYSGELEGDVTFRKIMTYYAKNYPWQQFGIDLVLGSGLDKKLTHREQMFSPIILMDALSHAKYKKDGKSVPMVADTRILIDGSDEGAVEGPTPFLISPFFVFLVLLAAVVLVSMHEVRTGCRYKWLDSVIFGAFFLVGSLVAFLVFVSTHYGTSPNLHFLWLHPLAIIPAVAVWMPRCAKLLNVYHILNAVIILALLVSWYWLPQCGSSAILLLASISMVRSVSYVWQRKLSVSKNNMPIC